MFWTPNVSSDADYARYEPDDMASVDLVGIDYYPKQLSGNDFLNTMQSFHDKYAVDGRKFAIGETGSVTRTCLSRLRSSVFSSCSLFSFRVGWLEWQSR